jgi:hypothetical protein
MFRSTLLRALLGICALHTTLGLGGCSSGDAAGENESDATGTLSLPLLSNAGGHTYRLTGAIEIHETSNYWNYRYLDLNEESDVASTSLQTGDYYGYLYSWQLSRDDGTGTFQPVSASLMSSSQPYFSIFNGGTTTVSFDFETNGQIVSVGSGNLKVDIDVNEVPGVCSPLGNDCPEGSWCAPSELLGADVRCIQAGSVELGGACLSPFDCVANSSCFDFGNGAQCARLCSSAEFDQLCADGGTCTAEGADYGVCSPEPLSP